jgi:hypothetical protein
MLQPSGVQRVSIQHAEEKSRTYGFGVGGCGDVLWADQKAVFCGGFPFVQKLS